MVYQSQAITVALPSSSSQESLNEECSFPIHAAVGLLLPELRSIEDAVHTSQIGVDWQVSPSFCSGLWRNFKEEFDLTGPGISNIQILGRKRFDEVRNATYQLKSMVALLDVMKTAAQNIITPAEVELRRTGHEFGRLLERIPAELLAITMRFACESVYDLLGLSHVNQRFRHIALTMTDVWSHVWSGMPTGFLRLCLERSKNAGLHLVLNEDMDDGDIDDFHFVSDILDSEVPDSGFKSCAVETARCCTRWERMNIIFPLAYFLHGGEDTYTLYRVLKKHFDTLDVPRLTKFSINHHGYFSDGEVSTQPQILECVHFYRSWKAPNLRTLTFSGGIIPVHIPGTSIETLSLDIQVDERFSGYMDFFHMLHDLHMFLQESHTLRKLEIRTFTAGESNSDQMRDFPIVTLGSLQELVFIVDYVPLSPMALNSFLFSSFVDCLRLPALTTLSVELGMSLSSPDNREDENVTAILSSLIPRLGHASPLTNLSLFVRSLPLWDSQTVSVALDQYPSLRTLTLGIAGNVVASPGSTLHPNVRNRGSLEQINLLACGPGTEEFLAWVVNQLRKGDKLRKPKFAVKKCASAREGRLLEFISPDQLEFEG